MLEHDRNLLDQAVEHAQRDVLNETGRFRPGKENIRRNDLAVGFDPAYQRFDTRHPPREEGYFRLVEVDQFPVLQRMFQGEVQAVADRHERGAPPRSRWRLRVETNLVAPAALGVIEGLVSLF